MSFNSTPKELIEQNINGLLSIHDSWQRIPMDLIAKITNGFAFKSSEFNNRKDGVPLVRIRDVLKGNTSTYYSGQVPEGYWIYTEDLIVGMDGDFNATIWRSEPALLNQRVCRIEVNEENYDKRFFFHVLPGYLSAINANTSSVTVKHLSSKTLQGILFPLPPLAEQKIIAEKLDTLLAQVDSAKARLEQIPKILKRFRQAVLAAAISGNITQDLQSNPTNRVTHLGLSIPSEWSICRISDFSDVKGGKRLPKGESLTAENTGYPYIRAGQLKNGTVQPEDQLYLHPETQKMISRYVVSSGDVYITIVGACIGDAGIIPEQYHNANLTENAAKICNIASSVLNKYLSIWLRSAYLQHIIHSEIKSGAQGKLALSRIKSLPLIVPPQLEQHEIVRRVEQLFAYADTIEKQANNALARVNNLTQSILAKAFQGELTAEWREKNPELISGDNSAAALLEKIKAERAARTGKKASRKKC